MNLKPFGLLSALAVLLPSFASGFEVSRNYSLAAGEADELDKTCLSALESDIVPEFVGLTGVQLPSPSVVFGTPERVTLMTYAGAIFESDFKDARGTLSCIFKGGSVHIWTVSVTFEGRGLAGFTKHPLADLLKNPAEQRALSYASEFSL